MSDATTRAPRDDVPPKATEVLDPALEEIKWGLEEAMRARDAEIRELKARNEYLQKALDALFHAVKTTIRQEHEGEIVFEDSWGPWPITSPELLAYLCERNGWPNPLEGGEG
ncbi:hypothetical protein [Microcystis phage Mae-JY24]